MSNYENCSHIIEGKNCKICGAFVVNDRIIFKPHRNVYQYEVHPLEIFSFMIKNLDTTPKGNLNRNYPEIRSTLVSIMRLLNSKLKFRSQTFFLAVHYMDIILNTVNVSQLKVKLLALSSLLIAAKYDENDPSIPDLYQFQSIASAIDKYYPVNEIRKYEVLCLQYLNYKLNHFTAYHFLYFFFAHGVMFTDQLNTYPKDNKSLHEKLYIISRDLLDLVTEDGYQLIEHSSLNVSCAILYFAREIFASSLNIENDMDKILKGIYEIPLDQYNETLVIIKSIYEQYKTKQNLLRNSSKKISTNDNRRKTNIVPVDNKLSTDSISNLRNNFTIDSLKLRPRAVSLQKDRNFYYERLNSGRPQKDQSVTVENVIDEAIQDKEPSPKLRETKVSTVNKETNQTETRYDENAYAASNQTVNQKANSLSLTNFLNEAGHNPHSNDDILNKTKKIINSNNTKEYNRYNIECEGDAITLGVRNRKKFPTTDHDKFSIQKQIGSTIIINNNININTFISKNYLQSAMDFKDLEKSSSKKNDGLYKNNLLSSSQSNYNPYQPDKSKYDSRNKDQSVKDKTKYSYGKFSNYKVENKLTYDNFYEEDISKRQPNDYLGNKYRKGTFVYETKPIKNDILNDYDYTKRSENVYDKRLSGDNMTRRNEYGSFSKYAKTFNNYY